MRHLRHMLAAGLVLVAALLAWPLAGASAMGLESKGSASSEKPALDLRLTESLDSRITFTRASPATCFDSTGTLVTFASGAARLPCYTFDGTTWNNRGLLVEELLKNLALQSEDVSTTWINVRSTETTDSVAAPDGNTTADTLRENGSTATTHYIQQTLVNADFTDDVDYTFFVFVKKTANRNWVKLSSRSKGNVTTAAFFNVDAGTIGNVDAGQTARIKDVGGGWFRCSITKDIGNGAANPAFLIIIAEANGDSVFDGLTQDSLYVWGAQVGKGSVPLSYIATTTVQVERAADVPTMTDLSWFNQNAGTFYLEGSFPFVNSTLDGILTVDAGSFTNMLTFERDSSGNINFRTVHPSDVDGDSNGAAVIAVDTTFRVVGVYADDDVRAAVDGTLSPADTTAALPLSGDMTTVRLGANSLATQYNGFISRIVYWNRALPPERLQDKSTFLDWVDGPALAANDNEEWLEVVGW